VRAVFQVARGQACPLNPLSLSLVGAALAATAHPQPMLATDRRPDTILVCAGDGRKGAAAARLRDVRARSLAPVRRVPHLPALPRLSGLPVAVPKPGALPLSLLRDAPARD